MFLYDSFLNIKNEKVKLKSGNENTENDQKKNLDKANEFSDPKLNQKSSDNINNTKVCHNIIIYCVSKTIVVIKMFLFS